MAEQAKFLEGNLFRHISVMSFTAATGLMAVFFVDLVDMLFISMLGKEELAAAVGYAGAILFFTSSFGIGMAIASGALVAKALGGGEDELAQQKVATSLIWGVVFGSIFAGVVWLNIPALAALMGASGETLELASGYLRIIIPSLPLLLIGMVGGAILRAHGDAKRSMNATLMGGLVNAVLDPILIFGLNLDRPAQPSPVFAHVSPSRFGPSYRSSGTTGYHPTQSGAACGRPAALGRDRFSSHPDAVGHANRTGLCHAFHGGLWRRGCGRYGNCRSDNAGGFWHLIALSEPSAHHWP